MNAVAERIAGYSIEATAKDAASFCASAASLLHPAAVFIPYLPEENDAARIAACAIVRAAGFEPVPHISARRLESIAALDRLLTELRAGAAVETIFLIAGDIAQPVGPFADSLSVIQSGLIERHGIKRVGIAGHPDGHPDVAEDILWQAMDDKIAALHARGLEAEIVTQFSFDAQQVTRWIGKVRARGVVAPIRVGIPGPSGVRTLLRYAARCGVAASASAVAKYGLSLGRLFGNAGPDHFIGELHAGLDSAITGDVRLHVFPFGGFANFADWLAKAAAPSASSYAA